MNITYATYVHNTLLNCKIVFLTFEVYNSQFHAGGTQRSLITPWRYTSCAFFFNYLPNSSPSSDRDTYVPRNNFVRADCGGVGTSERQDFLRVRAIPPLPPEHSNGSFYTVCCSRTIFFFFFKWPGNTNFFFAFYRSGNNIGRVRVARVVVDERTRDRLVFALEGGTDKWYWCRGSPSPLFFWASCI